MLELLAKIGWLKVGGFLMGVLVLMLSAAYWKGCNDGTEKTVKEYRAKLDESELKYQKLLNAPAKVETRTVTRYVKLPPTTGTVAAIALEETENPLGDIKRSEGYHVDGPGIVSVTHFPLELPVKQFEFRFEPEPMKIDTVYVTVTKTAVEYVDISVFEKAEFYIGVVVAGVIGYAAAGGF